MCGCRDKYAAYRHTCTHHAQSRQAKRGEFEGHTHAQFCPHNIMKWYIFFIQLMKKLSIQEVKSWPEVAGLQFKHRSPQPGPVGREGPSPSSMEVPAGCLWSSEPKSSIITGLDLASRITMTKFIGNVHNSSSLPGSEIRNEFQNTVRLC